MSSTSRKSLSLSKTVRNERNVQQCTSTPSSVGETSLPMFSYEKASTSKKQTTIKSFCYRNTNNEELQPSRNSTSTVTSRNDSTVDRTPDITEDEWENDEDFIITESPVKSALNNNNVIVINDSNDSWKLSSQDSFENLINESGVLQSPSFDKRNVREVSISPDLLACDEDEPREAASRSSPVIGNSVCGKNMPECIIDPLLEQFITDTKRNEVLKIVPDHIMNRFDWKRNILLCRHLEYKVMEKVCKLIDFLQFEGSSACDASANVCKVKKLLELKATVTSKRTTLEAIPFVPKPEPLIVPTTVKNFKPQLTDSSLKFNEMNVSNRSSCSNEARKLSTHHESTDLPSLDPESQTLLDQRNSSFSGENIIEFDSSFEDIDAIEPVASNDKVEDTSLIITTKKLESAIISFCGNYHDDGGSEELKRSNYPHSQEMLTMFHQVFGLKEFRTNQLQAINAALLENDCFILMPTGGGKSLCYQLPALITLGITLVISPLRSLIQDQVQKLRSLDVPVNHLSGEQNLADSNMVYSQLLAKIPEIKILYVTPEKIRASKRFISTMDKLYKSNMLSRFIIDEAHCVSQWGHDFRPDYKELGRLRENYSKVPIMALTATATQRVRMDVLNQLGIRNPKCFLQSFNRPNLRYVVLKKMGKSVISDIIKLIKESFNEASGIIYCLSRKECDETAKGMCGAGIKAVAYHAGLKDNERVSVQVKWINDTYKVVCATIAFGMGIDKPDVRFVLHHSLPKSMEGYYQESGRAGRDGRPSTCILYYSYNDVHRHRRLIQQDIGNYDSKNVHFNNLYQIVLYCENKTDCRRSQQLQYFGEDFSSDQCASGKQLCDNCTSKGSYEKHDVTSEATAIVQFVVGVHLSRSKMNLTLLYLVDVFRGSKLSKILSSGHDKCPLHGLGANYDRSDAERLLRRLIFDNVLKEDMIITKDGHVCAYITLGTNAQNLLNKKQKVFLDLMKGSKKSKYTTQSVSCSGDNGTTDHAACLTELQDVCKKIAAQHKMYHTNVMHPMALRQMSVDLPMCEEEMLKIPHVTKANFEKYGAKFLEVTSKYAAEKFCTDDNGDDPVFSADENPFMNVTASSSSSRQRFPGRGTKRKRGGWAGRGFKRTKKSTPETVKKNCWISKSKPRGFKASSSSASTSSAGMMAMPSAVQVERTGRYNPRPFLSKV